MKSVFADTSFYVAILNPLDALHLRAKAAAAAHKGDVVTTEFILVELGNFFCRGNGRAVYQGMVENLRSAEGVDVVPASAELFEKGYALFTSRSDKEWSLTDCMSFVVMWERSCTEALSADHHFEQFGVRALLK